MSDTYKRPAKYKCRCERCQKNKTHKHARALPDFRIRHDITDGEAEEDDLYDFGDGSDGAEIEGGENNPK